MPPANPTTNGVHEPRENGRISRGLSKTVENGGFVTNARLNVAKGLAQAAVADSKKECHIETPSYAF
uniref:Uncharacterized protein n=1 Tax=Plectus sambesii TaxID=2011161 RepID=A0A914VPB3_9BILA